MDKLKQKIEAGPGTDFDKKVWIQIAGIPSGETRSYQWIAKRLKSPKASRAVANACGRNPYAPSVPCHRVICSSGSLGGYSGTGGLSKKRHLLRKEGVRI